MSDDDDGDVGNGRLAAHGLLAKLAWALRSEAGEVRPHNEDFAGAFAPTIPDDAWDRGPLFAVCDGLGGHAAGEVASRLAVTGLLDAWTASTPGAPHKDLRAAARAANLAVYDAAMQEGKRGMGTTLTALTLCGREAVIGHVGDSRAYLVRDGRCAQLTADHSRVGEMLRLGLLTPEQAASHPARSQLTKSLGSDPMLQVDVVRSELATGDVFVLCSDGLWDSVSRAEIADVASAVGTPSAPTVVQAADQLVDLALAREAPDNVTALVVKVTSDRPIPPVAARRSLFRRAR
jgi:protein phosphatase